MALPPGVKLSRTLAGHTNRVMSVAFDAEGGTLASGSADRTVRLWDTRTGALLRILEGHALQVTTVAFVPRGELLASGGDDRTVKLWDSRSGRLVRTLEGHASRVWGLAFDASGGLLASASGDHTIRLWDVERGTLLHVLEGHRNSVYSVAFDPPGRILASASADQTVRLWDLRTAQVLHVLEGHRRWVWSVAFDAEGRTLASGSADKTVRVWDVPGGRMRCTLEGHTGFVDRVAFAADGRLLVSKSDDHTLRLWDRESWETVAVVPELSEPSLLIPALALHPALPRMATAGSEPDTPDGKRCRLIHLWELDAELLLASHAARAAPASAVHHTTGKIVLLGDHSVGKSALGYRLIHGHFEKQDSTHGQQFWIFPALGKRRADGTECEAILWDFAGQPDYRLVHALFVDNADLALVLFDAADLHDPLHGVGFWLKQLGRDVRRCPVILVAARSDRGVSSLTYEELEAFCRRNGIAEPVTTSASTGAGIEALVEQMKSLIAWDEKPATVTTATFKWIKDYVLGLKEAEPDHVVIVTPEELRRRLQTSDAHRQFTDAEMLTAAGHLENYGYVKRLRTSRGDLRILLQPERLNNLASSFVLEARRNPKGLGALEEKRLLAGGYAFPELRELSADDRDVLLDSAVLLFLEHHVCFRETDPLRVESYLIFPELINLKKPVEDDAATEDGVAYTVSGPTENVFASLVVLLGYTHTFTRTAQWQNNARYEVGEGLVCGFRQERERDGALDFVLCFAPRVGTPVRILFQGLFESFLARRNLTVTRHEPLRCSNGHLLHRAVVHEAMQRGDSIAFCPRCGERLTLPRPAEPIQLTRRERTEVDAQRRVADQRTQFEQAVFRVRAFAAEQQIRAPECFISYAWGVPDEERWVEKRLATDLQKAGIRVVLDRWEIGIGTDVARFIARIETADRILMVGTPGYRRKYDNRDSGTGSVVAAEVDLINNRLLGTEQQKASVLPLLLHGDKTAALPPLLHGRVHADFRDESAYFATAFDLILSLYQLPPHHPAVADLRETLREPGIGQTAEQRMV